MASQLSAIQSRLIPNPSFMKKLLFVVHLTISALSCVYAANNTVLSKLVIVNAEWTEQKDGIALLDKFSVAGDKNYNDWIATHLMLVEATLKSRSVSHLSKAQAANRANCLNELRGYWQAGSFPINDYVNYKTPVFIDRKGTHCAVGYLMMRSGHNDLAKKINSEQPFAYVYEIKTNGVKEWADKNGFTLGELAWIQPTYPCVNAECSTGEQRNVSCFGKRDGCIGTPVVTGFPMPYLLEFFSGHDTTATCNMGCNSCDLGPGDYTYRITDATSVNHYFFYTITEPDSLSDSAIVINSCYAQNTGSISLNITGGIKPYQYLWDDFITDSARTNLTPGNHLVQLTDSNSCRKDITISVPQSDSLYSTITSTADNGNCNATATIHARGGSGGYAFYVNNVLQQGSIFAGLCAGNNTFKVMDALGCSKTDSVTIALVSGVDVLSPEDFAVFPNPANNQLFIKASSVSINELKIYNTAGSLVLSVNSPQANQPVSVANLSQGVYIAEINISGSVKRCRWAKM